jgi:Flp pilus assembly protein TadD
VSEVNGSSALLIARFAATEQDMDVSAPAYVRALSFDPDNSELRQQAFLANLLANTPETVMLASRLPQNPAAILVQANDAARRGDWVQAEARFAALPRQGLFDILRPMLVAWVRTGAGHPDQGIEILRPLVENSKFRPLYALHAMMIADVAGRKPDGSALLRLTQTEPGGSNLQVTRELATWMVAEGRPADAEQLLRRMTEQNEEMPLALRALTAVTLKNGRKQVTSATDGLAEVYLAGAGALRGQDANEFAKVMLHLALNVRPDLTTARLLGTEIAVLTKHPERGLQLLAQVSAGDPLFDVVRFRRALLLDSLGKTDEALALMEQLAKEHADRPEPLVRMGSMLRAKRRFPEAVAAYDRAMALIATPSRNNWPLFYERGIALERAHDWPRAEQDFLRALDLAPDQPFVMNYLAYSWADMGRNLPRARAMLERAATQRPSDGAIIDSLGWVILRQGDVAAAVTKLERAIELDAADPTINSHLGDAYWAAGRKLEAQFQWRRALALNPEPEDVGKLEAKLRDGFTMPAIRTP